MITGMPIMFSNVYQRMAAPNNGMHPAPHQRASYVCCVGARVMQGVMPLG